MTLFLTIVAALLTVKALEYVFIYGYVHFKHAKTEKEFNKLLTDLKEQYKNLESDFDSSPKDDKPRLH